MNNFKTILMTSVLTTLAAGNVYAEAIHPLPPYPKQEQQNERFRANKIPYDIMREVFTRINDKNYEKTPSFRCSASNTEAEKLICSDKDLSELDAKMALLHEVLDGNRERIVEYPSLSLWNPRKEHIEWLNARNTFKCTPHIENRKKCLKSLYEKKIHGQLAYIFLAIVINDNERLCFEKEKSIDKNWLNLFSSQEFSFNYSVGYFEENCPIFYYIVNGCSSDYFSYALDHGVNVNFSNEYCSPILFSVGDEEDIDKILKKGANVNAISNGTPLIVSKPWLAEKILPLGADVNAVDDNLKWDALMNGVNLINLNYLPKFIKILKKYGINIKRTDKNGDTAYDLFVKIYNNPLYYNAQKQKLNLTDEEMKYYTNKIKKLLNN